MEKLVREARVSYVSANGATKFAPIPSVLGIGNASNSR